MSKLIKISDTKAYRISIIQMGANVKGEAKKPKLLSIRQMYATKKDPTFKPAYQGITIPLDIGARVIKGLIAVFKDKEAKVEIILPKEKEK
jgi:hypothetical protein